MFKDIDHQDHIDFSCLNIADKITIHDLVEVGCGAGGILASLAEKNTSIKTLKGYDISPQAISLAEKRKSERVRFY